MVLTKILKLIRRINCRHKERESCIIKKVTFPIGDTKKIMNGFIEAELTLFNMDGERCKCGKFYYINIDEIIKIMKKHMEIEIENINSVL